MAVKVFDDFNRANGPVGTSSSGHPWEVLRGTFNVQNSKGTYAYDGNEGNSLAVLNTGFGGEDATISLDTPGGGSEGGFGLIFRATDANNFWRLGINRYIYSFTYSNGNHNVLTRSIHCTYSASGGSVGYTYANTYYYNHENGYIGNHGNSDFPQCPAQSPYDGSSGTLISSVGREDQTVEPHIDSGSAIAYELQLDRIVNGGLSRVKAIPVGTSSSLAVTLAGPSIRVFYNGAEQANMAASDAFNQTATKHGFGWHNSSYGNTGIDNFAATPTRTGLYVPAVML
jgi:hypothetical protein